MNSAFPFLPGELLGEVVDCLIRDNVYDIYDKVDDFSKPQWKVVDSFSRSSKELRIVLLQHWFGVFCIKNKSDWNFVTNKWPAILVWARLIECDVNTFDGSKLSTFVRANRIRITDYPGYLPFGVFNAISSLPSSIHDLDLRAYARDIDDIILRIVDHMPQIRVLRLDLLPRMECSMCNTMILASLPVRCPERLTYAGAKGLKPSFYPLLSFLQELYAVYFRVSVMEDYAGGTPISDGNNPLMWSGECRECLSKLNDDKALRTRWLESKMNPGRCPPNLKKVEWNFIGW